MSEGLYFSPLSCKQQYTVLGHSAPALHLHLSLTITISALPLTDYTYKHHIWRALPRLQFTVSISTSPFDPPNKYYSTCHYLTC